MINEVAGGTPSVAVIHLVRNGNPPHLLTRFLASYASHSAGMPHRLVFVLKGFSGEDAARQRQEVGARQPNATFIEVSDEGFDINAYRQAASVVEEEFIVFLNSHSAIAADLWLAKLIGGFQQKSDAGVVGATGSWESIWEDAPFPNPHIRTNAFAIRRADFLALDFGPLDSKAACHRFEAGGRSMTRQVQALGREAYVVDGNGELSAPETWFENRTFRSGRQEALLVSDNQTRNYMDGSHRHSRKVARLSWGDKAIVPRLSLGESVLFFLRRLAAGRF